MKRTLAVSLVISLTFILISAVTAKPAADIAVSGHTSTLKSAAISPANPATIEKLGTVNETPGFDFYTSSNYLLKTDYDAKTANEVLEILELAYPHIASAYGNRLASLDKQLVVVYASGEALFSRALKTDGVEEKASHFTSKNVTYHCAIGSPTELRSQLIYHAAKQYAGIAFEGIVFPAWFGEGMPSSLAMHVYNSEKKQLTVHALDTAAAGSEYAAALSRLQRPNAATAQNIYESGSNRWDNLVFVNFIISDSDRSKKLMMWLADVTKPIVVKVEKPAEPAKPVTPAPEPAKPVAPAPAPAPAKPAVPAPAPAKTVAPAPAPAKPVPAKPAVPAPAPAKPVPAKPAVPAPAPAKTVAPAPVPAKPAPAQPAPKVQPAPAKTAPAPVQPPKPAPAPRGRRQGALMNVQSNTVYASYPQDNPAVFIAEAPAPAPAAQPQPAPPKPEVKAADFNKAFETRFGEWAAVNKEFSKWVLDRKNVFSSDVPWEQDGGSFRVFTFGSEIENLLLHLPPGEGRNQDTLMMKWPVESAPKIARAEGSNTAAVVIDISKKPGAGVAGIGLGTVQLVVSPFHDGVFFLDSTCTSSGIHTAVFGLESVEGGGKTPESLQKNDVSSKGVDRVISVAQSPLVAAAKQEKFTAEWSGWFVIEKAGNYGFATSGNGGSWLWVNGELIVSNGGDSESRLKTGSIYLDRGPHRLRVQYFTTKAPATFSVGFVPPDKPGCLKVMIENGLKLVVDGQDLGMDKKEFRLLDPTLAAMAGSGHKAAIVTEILPESLKVTVRAMNEKTNKEAVQEHVIPLTKEQRKRLLEMPVSLLSSDPSHRITPYIAK